MYVVGQFQLQDKFQNVKKQIIPSRPVLNTQTQNTSFLYTR